MSAPPNASCGPRGDRLDLLGIGDVRLDRERLAAVRLDRRDGLAQLLGLQPGGQHARPRAASSAAVAAPIPVAAPVTIAVLPATDTARIVRGA